MDQANDTPIKLLGQPTLNLYSRDGTLKQTVTHPNLVVAAGRTIVAKLLAGEAASLMTHMAIGSGSATPNAADVTLGTELARVVFIEVIRDGTTITYTTSFDGVGEGPVTEAGIFNAATGGDMLCRATFGLITKEADDILTINWTITIV